MGLNKTREILDEMIDSGIIRELTPSECKKYPNTHEGYAFAIADSKKLGRLEEP